MLAVTLRENALTTLDALKTSLGIDPAEEDAQRDATLVQLINAASAWLETQLGRKLGKSTYRQKYCGTGTQMLSLEQYPIVSVERITDTSPGKPLRSFDICNKSNGVLCHKMMDIRAHRLAASFHFSKTRPIAIRQ